MLSFEQAGKILDEAADALPEGIYDDLNGGVNLIRGEKRDDDGSYIMGLYHHDEMGRWIEIFYGSFAALYPEDDALFAEELTKTLHHELTHHIEGKAGDRTLERWDEEQKLLWEQGEPLSAERVLFVDDDGALSAEAVDLFVLMSGLQGLVVDSAAAKTAEVTAEQLKEYDVALCMTAPQADALAAHFPTYDEKILCFGEVDIVPPKAKRGWAGVRRVLRREMQYLVDELCEGNKV